MIARLNNDDTKVAVSTAHPLLGTLALLWGAGGFFALLSFALARLGPLVTDSFNLPWGGLHWVLFVINLLVMAWYEGYKGFQLSYSPRFGARCAHLFRHATPLQALLAPLVCMGFIYAPRRRMIAAWALTIAIVVVILLYRQLPQPWRGILDAGVVVGLAWGMAATAWHVIVALWKGPRVDPQMSSS